jgi:hypothetical protein
MPARPEIPVADAHTETLFEGVNVGSWHATSFETTPPVSMERCREQVVLMSD